ncbi:MAG: M3 family oligoendopeptidase, partial [Acetatifactor sp.]|nr:M3 family oligoendopeptidase [Acetatifactor sp.]
KLMDDINTNATLASVRHSIDTTDEFYEKENDFYDNFTPILTQYINEYNKVLFESPYRDYLEAKIGKVAFKNTELQLRAFDEKIIPLMQEENALVSRYEKLIATAKIPFEGEVYNLSLMRKFCTDADREKRKLAWKAVSDYFQSVTDEIDEIYDLMVKNRTKQARELGFENFVELGYLRMQRNSYGKNEVEAFRRQVKESFVPFVTRIQEERRKQIGVDNLKLYDNDVYFKNGNPMPIGTPEEILKAGQKMYQELSPETAEFMNFMMENELFDVLGRKTKRAGGYMTYIPNYKAPFIFANFNGTSSDVDVITHECGHAFQGYVTRNDEIHEHNDLTMETAEIHSMSMEYFTYDWMGNFFGDRKDDYYKMHLQDSTSFIPYGCMVDEFQHIVYSNPEMTPAQRKETWKKLEETYRPWIDFDNDPFFANGGWWQKQSHIFSVPFYYIDYVLASICAMQFKVWMNRDFHEAWEAYLKLCKMSVKDFYVPELKAVGLDSPFEDGCIEKIVAEFQKIC